MAFKDDDDLDVIAKDAVVHHHHKVKHKHEHKHKHHAGGKPMNGEAVNIFSSNPGGMGYGGYGCHDGFGGGGMIGGLLVGALLGRGGLGFGGYGGGYGGYDHGHHGGHCHERHCASTDEVLDILEMNKLGDIQAAIPLAEAQTQLALAGMQNKL